MLLDEEVTYSNAAAVVFFVDDEYVVLPRASFEDEGTWYYTDDESDAISTADHIKE